MNSTVAIFLLSQTILLPALVGIVRWSKIDKDFRPFVLSCLAISVSEVIRFISIELGYYGFGTYNIFLLINMAFTIWVFASWGIFRSHPKLPFFLWLFFAVCWIIQHFLLGENQFHQATLYIRLLFSLIHVLLALVTINSLIISERKSLLANPKFLVSTAILVYYTYRILVDSFSIQGMSKSFLGSIGDLNRYLVQLKSILFLIAALWIPRKKNYILPS